MDAAALAPIDPSRARDADPASDDENRARPAQDDDAVFDEFRHSNGVLARVGGDEGVETRAVGSLDAPSQSSPPWMRKGETKAKTQSRKRAREAGGGDDDSFLADDDEDLSEDASESEMAEESDADAASESSLGSASDEDEGAGFGGGGAHYAEDFSTNPVASRFRAPAVKGVVLKNVDPKRYPPGTKPTLKFSVKKPVAARAVVRSEDEDSDSGSTSDEESEEEDAGARQRSETKARLDALAQEARDARGAPSYRQREDYVMQREDDEFDDYRPDQEDWKNAGGDATEDEDRAYEECKNMSKRLRNTLKEAAHAENGRLPVFSVDNVVEATGGMDSGTFSVNLKPYQMVGVNFLMLLQQNAIPGAILADEMGLGKTAQAIAFIATSRYHPDTGALAENGVRWPRVVSKPNPVLVVSPASLLENWKRELGMWAPNMRVGVFHGESRADVRQTEEYHRERTGECCYDVIIVCYSLFERDSIESQDNRSWLQRMEFSHLILDEAHLLKNRDAQRTIRLTRTARKAHYRLLLTGTPLQNNLRELEALIEFVLPGLLKHGELGEGLEEDDQSERRVKKVRRILEPFVLRRLKETVAKQLAPKVQVKDVIAMSGRQAEAYKLAVDRIRREALEGKTRSANGIGLAQSRLKAIFVHLRKVANHPLLVRNEYTDEDLIEIADICHKKRVFGPDARLERVKEHVSGLSDFGLHQLCGDYMLDGALKDKMLDPEIGLQSAKVQRLQELLVELKAKGSRPLIFSQWKIMLDILEWVLHHMGWKYARLDGDTAVDNRQELVDRFNAKDSYLDTFILSTRAGGQGLNLTGADTVILHDCDFNPQIDRQAEDRCHRLGQTKTVTVYRLVTEGSVDEKIVAIAEQKLNLGSTILAEGDQAKPDAKDETRAMQAIIEELVASGD
jgi:SWI/SNF-related matrix-associated actin-dependent regulator 1 of chromatin subfamily A